MSAPGRLLPRPDRTAVMGVLNVTPDSFSDGGRYADLEGALAHARAMWESGADVIDIGGESTRPGSGRVTVETEMERVLPIVRTLSAEGLVLSVDTTRSAVAAAAIDAGAQIINDVSGGLADPEMARVLAQARVPWVLMHWRGHSKDMNTLATYTDVVAEVRNELAARIDAALKAGVQEEAIVLDPGLGFAKHAEHDWALLNQLDVISEFGFPVLVGAARKRFLGRVLADCTGTPRPTAERENATVAVSTLAAARGVWGVRVHDVLSSLDAVKVAAAWQRGYV